MEGGVDKDREGSERTLERGEKEKLAFLSKRRPKWKQNTARQNNPVQIPVNKQI
jgi:hypothetical protein